MKLKLLLATVCLLLVVVCSYAQKRVVATTNASSVLQQIRGLKRNVGVSLFTLYNNPLKAEVEKDIKNPVFLKLNRAELERIYAQKPSAITLDLPLSDNSNAKFYLKSTKLLSDNFKVVNDKNEVIPYTQGVYYQGTVAGNTPSLASWSLFSNDVVTVFSWNNDNYEVGLWKHPSNINKDIYILYQNSNVLFHRHFSCGADRLPAHEPATIQQKSLDNTPQPQSNNCVKIYFECDYQMYLDNGNSTTNVANYVTAFFNSVQTIYTNESIGMEISEIYTWTTSDPYLPYTTSDDLLSTFETYRTSFNGDLGHLLTTRNLYAGGLAYLDALCYPQYAYGISNIDNTYSNYPTYSWTVEVVSHELGHNVGSHHTHWCGWNGGALDDCYTVEGNCSPGPTPTNGGTIMSYCHLVNTGILLTNGFGTQPGNAIRTAYNAASCLTACTPTDPVCANPVTINACGSGNSQTFNGGGTGSWNNTTASVCGNLAPGMETVYSFTPATSGVYSIQVTAASGNVHYAWKESPCGTTGWTCIGNINAPGQYGTLSLTGGTTYYIMLDDEDNTTGTHTFYINCPLPTGPCANVTALSGCGSANAVMFNGGTTGYWHTSVATPCGYLAQGAEKIYSFVAPTTGTYSIQITSALGYMDYLWKTGTCDSTGWNCIVDTNRIGNFGAMAWTAGTTYYILVDDEALNNIAGSHTFYIDCPGNNNTNTDPCASITPISGCGSANAQSWNGGTAGSWNTTTTSPCGYLAAGAEKIYSFVAPVTGTYSIEITAATGYVDYLWKTATCDANGWTCIEDTNAVGQYGAMQWTAGTTYYLLLDDEALSGTASSHTFYIHCPNGTNTSSPCMNTTSIAGCGVNYVQSFVGDTTSYWHTTVATACGVDAPSSEKIYTFVPAVTGTYSITITAVNGSVSYLWKTGACDSLGWNCIVDTNAIGQYGNLSWTAGTTYYILLDDESTGGNTSAHSFYIDCADTSNSTDPCANVIAISNCGPGAAQSYTGGGSGMWNTSTTNACNHLTPGVEQVYSFVPSVSGVYSIRITSASGYVGYQWQVSSCVQTGWSCIGNLNAAGLYGSLNWTAGTTYYILLDDENSTAGTHTFYIECVGGSNPCGNATAIAGCGVANTQTYTGGGSGVWNTSSINPCGFSAPGAEAIYTFAPPASGTYNIKVTAANGKVDYLWKASSCGAAGWTCIDDIDSVGQYGNMSWAVGTTYYILLDDENATPGTHSFYIDCSNTPAGIAESTTNSGITIYPNPNTGNFVIIMSGVGHKQITVTIFNVIGQVVYTDISESTNGTYSRDIAVDNKAKGIYTVRVAVGDKTYHKKVIVE